MVRRALQAMYQEIRGLHQAAYVLAIFAFGSQLLALVRDRLLAHQFGAGMELDIYYAAFRIPDLLFVLFASTLSVYVLIPFVASRLDDSDFTAGRDLLSQVFSLFLVFYAALALAIGIFAPAITAVVFPGFSEAAQAELVMLMRILLIQPFFLGVSSLFGVITQLGQRFVLYAISPLLYNVGIIVGILFFYPTFGLSGLAFGVVLGAIAHAAVQIPFIRGSSLAPHFVRSFDFALVGRILRTSLPRAVTLSLHQLVFLALVGIASVMAVGSVSVFQFAYNLQSVPLAIIGVSYSVAAFPTLARLFSKGEHSEFALHVTTALRHIFFWALPVVALVVVIRAQIVRVILGSGAFNWEDTRLTAAALALFVLSLVAQAINLLLVRAFYAGGNTRIPLVLTLCSSAGALIFAVMLYMLFVSYPVFSAFLESLFRVELVVGTEVLMLPLGFSIALIVHSIVLLFLFIRKYDMPTAAVFRSFWQSFWAAILGGVAAYIALNILVDGIRTETFMGIFLQGFLAGVTGIVSAAALLYVVNSRELFEVWNACHRRFFSKRVVPPQDIEEF